MTSNRIFVVLTLCVVSMSISCKKKETPVNEPSKKPAKAKVEEAARQKIEVRLMTLDPGHFHAALVQKTMYEQVMPVVHVYAPKGPDVDEHLARIDGFNTRAENPTKWKEEVYLGDDYLEKMLAEKPGNMVVISGNNRRKAEYIVRCVDAGLNVLADKPMCIDSAGFELLKEAFSSAEKKGVLLYDIMTERSEITTILQKELVHNSEVFGELLPGTADDPSVVKDSVHHFFKYVAGKPLKRPGWYFDTTQQGEGIVDVTTHLVDLVMWESFPEEAIDYSDVEIKKATRWATLIKPQEYNTVTGLAEFPEYLRSKVNDRGELACHANGEIVFSVKGIMAKVSVTWNFKAPEGGQDTHYSVMKGTRSSVIIRQGKEQKYRPELYVEPATDQKKGELAGALAQVLEELKSTYPGLELEALDKGWHIIIPDKYRVGHEAHFGQVMERYLDYMQRGKLPAWEVTNMRTKYHITTKALEMARK